MVFHLDIPWGGRDALVRIIDVAAPASSAFPQLFNVEYVDSGRRYRAFADELFFPLTKPTPAKSDR